jgi:hypothetical protein
MNYQDELELIIRGCYPVLTIISNKETHVLDIAVGVAGKRRKKSANGPALQFRNAVHGAARRKN